MAEEDEKKQQEKKAAEEKANAAMEAKAAAEQTADGVKPGDEDKAGNEKKADEDGQEPEPEQKGPDMSGDAEKRMEEAMIGVFEAVSSTPGMGVQGLAAVQGAYSNVAAIVSKISGSGTEASPKPDGEAKTDVQVANPEAPTPNKATEERKKHTAEPDAPAPSGPSAGPGPSGP